MTFHLLYLIQFLAQCHKWILNRIRCW